MRGETILIIDDEKLIRWSLKSELTKAEFSVLEAGTKAEGLSLLRQHDPDLVLLDQMLPDGTGIDILGAMKEGNIIPPVIMLTAVDRSDVAVKAMKLGAFDYLTKPVNSEELLLVVGKALESTRLKRQVAHFLREQQKTYGFCGLTGKSPAMLKVFDNISRIAQSGGSTTVLITGESGTGKELAAKAIHFSSNRREEPLMTVNFSALTESLIESELFGHEKGAFTDAKEQKKGIFELADGGTIFLDEIGDISPKIQVKLLRVLEQKTFQRVGGVTDITVNVRIIAATNNPLDVAVEKGAFRQDLFYRLNVATIHLPPVRERGDDVLLLAEDFLQDFNAKFRKQFSALAPETIELFLRYQWPGNVRELRNVIERAVLLHNDNMLLPHHIEFSRLSFSSPSVSSSVSSSVDRLDSSESSNPTIVSLEEAEKQALYAALEKTGFNQSQAARLLQITRDTLRYRMKKYSIQPPDFNHSSAG